jgi:hypothetical protein
VYHRCHSDLRVRGRRKLHRLAYAVYSRSTMIACQLPRSHRLHSTCRRRDIEVVFTPRTPLRLVEEWKVHEQGDRRIPGVVEHGATVPQEWKRQAFRGYMAGRKTLMTMLCLIAHPSTCGPCHQLGDAGGPGVTLQIGSHRLQIAERTFVDLVKAHPGSV